MLTGQLENALAVAQDWSDKWESDAKNISLREQLIAETMMALGRDEEAGNYANEALSRLAQKKQQGIDDHRIATAELRAYAILGDKRKVSELVDNVLATKPADAVEDFNTRYMFAQSYAHAGMMDESLSTLDELLSGISAISVPWLELDPAFNGIRQQPEFTTLLEKHR